MNHPPTSFPRTSVPARPSAAARAEVSAAVAPVIERLEDRWLMSVTAPALYTPAAPSNNAFFSATPQIPVLTVSKTLLVFNSIATGHSGSGPSRTLTLTITNTGTSPLTFSTGAVSVVNDPANATQDASLFRVLNPGSVPSSLAAGASFGLNINYTAQAVARNAALLQIISNDPYNPTQNVQIHGIGTSGLGGSNEPALDRILRAYDIPTIVGQGPDDNNESSYLYPVTPDPSSQEVPMQLMQAANPSQPVTVTDLANFTDQTTVAYRLGYYNPASPGNLHELLYITKADSQTVDPNPSGANAFSPGPNTFGLYFQSPLLDNGTNRVGYSQSAYNTWDSTQQQKFRFFPMENADGSIVPNAYIVTTTEWNAPVGYDFHNIVAIIRNVKPASDAANAPILSLKSTDFAPASTNLLFSKVQVEPSSPILQTDGTYHNPITNIVHNTDTLVINNTGDSPLVINSLMLSSPAWQIQNAPAAGTSIAPGAALDVTIQFVATTEPAHSYNETNSTYNPNSGGIYSGTLIINSSDPVTPAQSVNLEGWWQSQDERDMEPSLQSVVNVMAGYSTQIAPANTLDLTQSSATLPTFYGEEVVSPYWTMADPNAPINVLALDAWHSQSYTNSSNALTVTNQSFGYYPAYTHSITNLVTTSGADAQSILPHPIINGSEVNENATANFTASGNFGFAVDGYEYSDDSMTPQNSVNSSGVGFGPGGGHVLRFFPLRSSNGTLVPNAYIVGLDYNAVPGQNFDFQDGLWIVTGIRPAGIRENNPAAGVPQFATAPAPNDIQATAASGAQGGGVFLQWGIDNTYTGSVAYNVYSSTSFNGAYTLLTSTPVTTTSYVDTTAVPGVVNYYRVASVDPTTGVISPGNIAGVLAGPATPAGLAATVGNNGGVVLNWTAGTQRNIAGYNIYRSTTPSGGFVLLNSSGPTSSATYNDANAPAGIVSYYQVTALDTAGNESAAAALTATANGATPLGVDAPSNPASTVTAGGVILNWTEATPTNLVGFNIYSGASASGPFTLLNTSGPLPPSQFTYTDATALSGATTYYQLVSVDTAGNLSGPSTVSAAVPALPLPPSTVNAAAALTGITLTWPASHTADVAGYNIYGGPTAGGPFVLLNTTGLLSPRTLTYADASPTYGQTVFYEVTTIDSLGRESAAIIGSATVPYPAPTVPTGLTAVISSNAITLNWALESIGDIVGYNVYRGTSSSGPFTLLTTSAPVNAGTYSDSTAGTGATWYYQVIAVDATARTSAAATANVYIPPIPLAPAILTATESNAGVGLNWAAAVETGGAIAGYNVFRSLSPTGSWVQVAAGVSGTTYLDATAAAGQTWYYQVVATDPATQVSPPSPTASVFVTYNPTPPAAPATLTASGGVADITIQWPANAEFDLAGYQLFRSASPTGGWVQVGGALTGTSFLDRSAPIGQASYYHVQAVNTSGVVSGVSPVASAVAARDLTPPPALSHLSAVGGTTGNSISWNASPVADLSGYVIYRSNYPKRRFVQLATTQQLNFLDATPPVGVRVYYQVVAVNTTGTSGVVTTVWAVRKRAPKIPKVAKHHLT